MSNFLERFQFRRSGRLVAVLLVLLAGCGGGQGGGEKRVRVSLTTPTKASFVGTVFGPVHYGPEFGLDMKKEDFLVFESHSTATQNVLADQTAILGGSFVSHLMIRERGQDFKAFCPLANLDDMVTVGRNGVTILEQFFDPNVRVGIDSAGGAGGIILNAMLRARGIDKPVADIPNTQIIESAGLRTSVFAAGGVDATLLHLYHFKQAAAQIPDATVISALYEDVPTFIKDVFSARSSWLEENQEVAAAFCASVLKASRELPKDFDFFVEAVNQFVGEPPSQELLKEIFDLVGKYDFWPVNGGLEPEAITLMGELAVMEGILNEVPDPEDVVDRQTLERALELVGGRVEQKVRPN